MLRAAAVFSNHMVLQRHKKICVFGEGEDGREITVSLEDSHARALCHGGRWTAYLPEREAAEGLYMDIDDGEEHIRFTDIAVGEVWLAGGQSNMELELKDADGGKEILQNGSFPLIRYYYTPKQAYKGADFKEIERASCWERFGEQEAAKWSAVGFYFARELAERLQVPVGIIGCNWGGTSASCWMSREAILSRQATRSYVEDYENSEAVRKSEAEQIRDYQEYQAYQEDWDRRAAAIYEREPMMAFDKVQELIGPCRYPGPMNCANFTRPAGLYETMLKRVAPYTLRGFLYYQGESDDHRPQDYYDLFTGLIEQWRRDWNDDRLPFLMVQLPMHRYQHDPDTRSWCIIRESQMRAFDMIRNTGIAVAIDCGQFHEIHPKNKRPVGERLALQALCGVYHLIPEEDAFGPIYRDFRYHKGGMELTFDHVGTCFICKGKKVSGFELAGADGVFREADIVILEGNKIFLACGEIENAVMARYLWTNYGEVTLFGTNGLPVAPFRTHEF
ncbi:MAG: sialate O-acetylesterase [bacterium]|nr:sialate O-acetylesterase [bacterium]MCM1373961.1 sialate O-acetylesterase [Muribaculum sp.]